MLLLSTLKRHTNTFDYSLIWKIQENLISAPYSLHKIIEISKDFDKQPGDWHSPSSIGYILTLLLSDNPVPHLKPMITMNCSIYKDELYSLACNIPKEQALLICKCDSDDYIDLGNICCMCGKLNSSSK